MLIVSRGYPTKKYTGNGVLIPVDDHGALVGAFRDMAKNAGRYSSAAIRQFALDNFSPARVAGKLMQVYMEEL